MVDSSLYPSGLEWHHLSQWEEFRQISEEPFLSDAYSESFKDFESL